MTPGKGTLPPLPDEDAPAKLTPEDARAHLERAADRIAAARKQQLLRKNFTSTQFPIGDAMLTFAAMLGLLAAADVPVVGRPLDFWLVGGPFKVTMQIEPQHVTVEQPFRLTLTIEGKGNLQDLERPAIDKIKSFAEFHPSGARRFDEAPPRRWFYYNLRVRRPEVREVPAFHFVYFNPKVTTVNGGFKRPWPSRSLCK